jgi:sortase B
MAKTRREKAIVNNEERGSAAYRARYTETGERRREALDEAELVAEEKGKREKQEKRDKPAPIIDESVIAYVKKKEKQRRLVTLVCIGVAVVSFAYFASYTYQYERTGAQQSALSALIGSTALAGGRGAGTTTDVMVHRTSGDVDLPPILEEYQTLFNKNNRLVGWLKIEDTNIDFPVLQTVNNTYYTEYNFNQQKDTNGSIFLDYQCVIYPRTTNLIVYGHNMQSGKMFGQLGKYEKEEYYQEHPQIVFDTIYEKGVYQIMYAFRSPIYNEEDAVFKYYQFIDAVSAAEFDSNMREMAALSLYDTGVTASFGDEILTLSTCDSQDRAGSRFVVVAKRVG